MNNQRLIRRYQRLATTRDYLELCRVEKERFALSVGVCVSRVLMDFHAPVHEWRGFACGTAAADMEKRESQVQRAAKWAEEREA
jgi:hypothetical protein